MAKGWLDNYGTKENENNSSVSLPEGFVGMGNNTKGRNYSPAWGGSFQTGGSVYPVNYIPQAQNGLWKEDRKAFVDSTLHANKNLDFVKRLYDTNPKSIQIPGEPGRSTHFMANDATRVYPTVVNKNGKLQYLSNPDQAWDYANDNKEYIDFKTPEQASWFANSPDHSTGYKLGTNVLTEIPRKQMGGSIPGTPGFSYARTNDPAPSEGPYAKKTMASAQNGTDMYGAPITADLKYDQSVKRTNYNPRTNQMVFGNDMPLFLSQEERDKTLAHENRHAWQFANDRTNFNMVHNPESSFQDRLQKRPEITSTDEVFEKYHNRKQKETEIDVRGFKQNNPQFSFVPNQMVYKKFIDSKQYDNPDSLEGEAQYYQNTGKQFQNGGEMQYYQQGLDFKPKSISKNGSWLSKYDVAQNGQQVEYGTPEYREAYNRGEVVTDQGVRSPIVLDEVIVNKKSPAPGFWKQSRDEYLKEHQDDSLLGALGSVATYPLGLAQQAMMYGLTDKVQKPSEGLDIQNPYGAVAINAVADPLVLGEGLYKGIGALNDLTRIGREEKVLSNISGVEPIDWDIFNKKVDPRFEEYMRKAQLQPSKSKEANSVLSDFKERIKTPEGIKRAKELNTNTDYLDKIKLLEDNTDYGYSSGQQIGLHKNLNDDLIKSITRHEIEHEVKNSIKDKALKDAGKWYKNLPFMNNSQEALNALNINTTPIDDILSELELRNKPSIFDELSKKDKFPKQDIDASDIKEKLSNRQKATDYFDRGSAGNEKSAFAAEAQQYMLDEGIIKHPYETITPEKIKEAHAKALFDKKNPIRLFHIMKNTDKNYNTLAKALNKMLTVTGAGALGAQVVEQKKDGGEIIKDDRGQWDHPGEITRISGGNITMKRDPKTGKALTEPLLGIADTGEQQMMYPGEDYNFEGANYVTEYPKGKKAQNGLRQEQKGLQNLDQLTNFTNYNKPQPGSWLEKYN